MPSYKDKLLNLKRGQYILYILILTLVVVFFWIAGSLFSSQRSSGISNQAQRLARPLNPNIDAEVLSEIENKRVFETQELSDFPIYRILRSEEDESQIIVPIGTEDINEQQSLSEVADQVIEEQSLLFEGAGETETTEFEAGIEPTSETNTDTSSQIISPEPATSSAQSDPNIQ